MLQVGRTAQACPQVAVQEGGEEAEGEGEGG